MIYLNACHRASFSPAALPDAVRQLLGKPLRRAAPLTQLAVISTLACLDEAQRQQPTLLLWQSGTGARQETLALLAELREDDAEPMPYDFLATQPAIAAAQLAAHLPGLQAVHHLPLANVDEGWALPLLLATQWLADGRYRQIVCARLDSSPKHANAASLLLSCDRRERSLATLAIRERPSSHDLGGHEFSTHLPDWVAAADADAFAIASPFNDRLALEFAKL